MKHPEIPAELRAPAKKRLNVVFATGPDGERYEIPLDVARQHPSYDSHPALLTAIDHREADNDEGQGHHVVALGDGIIGYYADWLIGPYVWQSDGNTYYGLHRHPFGWTNYLAIHEVDL